MFVFKLVNYIEMSFNNSIISNKECWRMS